MKTATTNAPETELPPKLEEESATERIQIVATERWTKRVDDWRRKHPDMPNRSKAIRLLVEIGLDKDDGAT